VKESRKRNHVPRDVFAAIAAGDTAKTGSALTVPGPPAIPERVLPLNGAEAGMAFRPRPRVDTPAKLARELVRLRKRMAPYLRDLAAPLESLRRRQALKTFDWREETAADRHDFRSVLDGKGLWEPVSIPHYGPPLGRAATLYRTSFNVTQAMLDQGAVFVCFRGADYRAQVFVNGSLAGTHEGFFAPFEFDVTACVRRGANSLLVRLENDAICMGNNSWGKDGHLYEGDKLYAATGPGWDDSTVGWHHCPPGMGLYQDISVEGRAPQHVWDLFVRPLPDEQRAELWVEVHNTERVRRPVTLAIDVEGLNFRSRVVRALRHEPVALMGPGANRMIVSVPMPRARRWHPDHPWLYRATVTVFNEKGQAVDRLARHFGMRTFRIDERGDPKGRLFLNSEPIRLRGANTMGHEQVAVMQGNLGQLHDDILLTKLGHMNFWRLTQRPVQAEIYDACDRLGLMTQTDLPLFAVLRRNQFCEAVRQTEEMERLVRCHPCNILVSYINEPFPASWGDRSQRQLTRTELLAFFRAADEAVRLANPDRCIKPIDGDYDPPGPGLPDNHCYCGWYNGHGVELGRLHKGFWQAVKPGWYYGCGEYGAEGLDSVDLMRRRYPPAWLPGAGTPESAWTPTNITSAQTGNHHYLWFDTQTSLAGWVAASQAHQAWATRLMTEAFRRDARMVSTAIHLLIDAWPAGWMKAVMDCERRPKPAYFAYRDALMPLMVNLRTDRHAYFGGETAELEAWICNDTNAAPRGARLAYRLEVDGAVIAGGTVAVTIPRGTSACLGRIHFRLPRVDNRTRAVARLALLDAASRVRHDTALELDLLVQPQADPGSPRVAVVGRRGGVAARLVRELGRVPRFTLAGHPETIVIDDLPVFHAAESRIRDLVAAGAVAVVIELPEGTHTIFASDVAVKPSGMGERHFVSRATGHPLVAGFQPHDFRFWHDRAVGRPAPLLGQLMTAPGWQTVLATGQGGWGLDWTPAAAAVERRLEQGAVRICLVHLAGRLDNPVARVFAQRLIGTHVPSVIKEDIRP
jgi:hypothetical protein